MSSAIKRREKIEQILKFEQLDRNEILQRKEVYKMKVNGEIPVEPEDFRGAVNPEMRKVNGNLFQFRVLLAGYRNLMIVGESEAAQLESKFPEAFETILKTILIPRRPQLTEDWVIIYREKGILQAFQLEEHLLTGVGDRNPYLFGKLLGYPEQDIEFYYIRPAGDGMSEGPGYDNFIKDRLEYQSLFNNNV